MSDAEEITANMADLQDWRGATLRRLRELIKQADPAIVEEIKWRKPSNPSGVPAYYRDGLIGTLEHYKDKVKFTFARGNELDDPAGLFTGGFGGKRRVIDLQEGDEIDADAFKALIRQAAALNGGA